MAINVKTTPGKTPSTPAKPSWLMSGADATQAFAQKLFAQQEAMESVGRMWPFYLGVGEEKTVTFLDGVLVSNALDLPCAVYEHVIQTGVAPPRWEQVVCIARGEICPLCESGNKPRFVGLFTVINHTPYTVQKGPNAGKVLVDRRELYKATTSTLQRLQVFAAKRNGLAGWKVEISRLTEKDARVGSAFQFLDHSTPEQLAAKYGPESQPADYETELRHLSSAEMVKAGFGVQPKGPGLTGGIEASAEEM